ncbi:zinc finger BED domain-containing protein RICESLEEPER 2-like protein [Tanacetum coccineum]
MASQSTSTTAAAGSSSAPMVVQILPNPDLERLQSLPNTLKNHINHPHCEALKRVAESGQSSMSRDGSIFVYNPDVLREQFAGLVIQRGLPFNHFDDEQTTRVFQKHLQPRYAHVSRTTLKRDAMKLWVMAKQAIIDRFLQINTNVNLTTDVWTPPHGVPGSYICVTAHWIEPGTWQMMKRVIAFEDFPVPHTGSALAKTLINVFVKFKLENKIMSITLDNASNNTSAIGKLRLKYEPPMEGRFYHSRCVAHIINLCVQDGLAVKEINTIKESFKTMLKDVFKSGGKNQQRCSRICKQAGNLVYHLIGTSRQDGTPLIIWLTQLLEVFNNATKVLSGVYYPTSPLVLQQIVFMTTKLTEYEFEEGIFATMVKPMKEKLKKYFERMPPIITCAAALSPCFNVHGVEFLIESISTDLELFDDSYTTKAKKWFNDSFEGLYNIYYTKYGNPTTTESSSGGGGSSSRASHGNQAITLLRRLKEHKNKRARSDPSLSSEYERYVHSDFVTMLQTTEFETFDVVGFWKAKETMFPVLSRMDMDILSVQATSVAYHLDTQESKQDKSTLETPVDFEEEVLDAEVQANEAIPLSDEEIALDAASSEGSMSEPSSGGEEAEAEPNYGYDVYNDDY